MDFADRAYMLRQQSDRQQCGSKVRMENDVGARDGSDDERQEIFRVSRYGFYDYPYGSKELLAQASLLSLIPSIRVFNISSGAGRKMTGFT